MTEKKHKKKDKKNYGKKIKEKPSSVRHDLHAITKETAKVAIEASESSRKEQKPDIPRDPGGRDARLAYDKIELARQFYWCDTLDFHMMHPSSRELVAFINSNFDTEDALNDVLHFHARVKNAQRHAAKYLQWRIYLKGRP